MIKTRTVLFAFLLCCGATTGAFAQDALQDAVNRCNDTNRTADDRIAACKRAVHARGLTPDDEAVFYLDLGMAYSGKDGDEDAIAAYSKAIETQPNLWQAYWDRALAYLKRGDFDNAHADYDRLMQTDMNKFAMYRTDPNIEYRTLPDGVKTNMSSSEREITEHTRAVSDLKGELIRAYAFRCDDRARNQALDGALADCNTALSLDSANAKVLELRGVVHMHRKEAAAARDDFEAAFKADPKSADALYLRGLAEGALGDTKSAGADMSAATAMDPQVAGKFEPATAPH